MEALQILSRSEMKMIKGGDGPCGVYYNGEWTCGLSPQMAQFIYTNNTDATGYCCASCGQTGFLGAARCAQNQEVEVE